MDRLKILFLGRLGRAEFFVGLIIAWLSKIILLLLIDKTHIIFSSRLPGFFAEQSAIAEILSQVVILLITIYTISLCVRRFHDIGNNGKLSILLAIDWLVAFLWPIIYRFYYGFPTLSMTETLIIITPTFITDIVILILKIYLLYKKGGLNTNNYGEAPKEKINIKRILIAN